jgi:hypothetical protein
MTRMTGINLCLKDLSLKFTLFETQGHKGTEKKQKYILNL